MIILQRKTEELIEVAEADSPVSLTWTDAKKYCQSLGIGWRLPDKEELNALYIFHTKGIGNFVFESYWGSEGNNDYTALSQNFNSGSSGVSSHKVVPLKNVRAVRSI